MVDVAGEHDPDRAAHELRGQMSSNTRRLGLLVGSGASMAVGLDGIEALTQHVAEHLTVDERATFNRLRGELGADATVEDVLNRVRLYREYFGEDEEKETDGLRLATVRDLDSQICSAIIQLLGVEPPGGLGPQIMLGQWLRQVSRDKPVEIFTTNYDLLLERAFEEVGAPYFDGFVGSVNPFFLQECVESDGSSESRAVYPPPSWTRLWKIHGSIGWRIKSENGAPRISRGHGELEPDEELLIYPTREKYIHSRRLPFITFLDQLRNFIATGEALLVIIGYSFRDDHLNEIIFEGLRTNNRAAVTALFKSAPEPDLLERAVTLRNLTLLGDNAASIGGHNGRWREPSVHGELPFWNSDDQRFTLGDFRLFAEYLARTAGLTPNERPAQDDASEETKIKAVLNGVDETSESILNSDDG